MPEAFDPYRKWLGIPAKDQPPNHYRLLGIELFEDDPDVIEAAADQRMAHVRTYQAGQNSALSQQILNELAAAKICLLDPKKKAAYDGQQRAGLAGQGQPLQGAGNGQPVAMHPVSELDTALATIGSRKDSTRSLATKPKRHRQPAWQLPAALGAIGVVLVAGFVWLVGSRRSGDVAPAQPPVANTARGATTNSAAVHEEKSDASQPSPPVVPPPQTVNADREVAEEVLRRGGQLTLLVKDRSIDALQSEDLPTTDLEVIEVRLLRMSPEKVADLAFLRRAKRMERLNLAGSPLPVASLAVLAGLESLKVLNVEDTQLPTGAVSSLLPMPQLEVLLLAGCEVTSQDLRDIVTLRSLRFLGLQGAKIGDDDMQLLRELSGLRDLILYNTPLTDVGLSTLTEVAPNLQSLCVAATKMTDEGVRSLGELKNLKSLDIAYNSQLSGAYLSSLAGPPEFYSLKLVKTSVTDDALAAIGKLGTLHELLLSENRITDAGLKQIASLSNLELLEVRDTDITATGVAELQRALPKCKIVANITVSE